MEAKTQCQAVSGEENAVAPEVTASLSETYLPTILSVEAEGYLQCQPLLPSTLR